MELKLSEMQLDALKELGNIGAGNSATALSQLLGQTINMQVPQVNVLDFDEMIKKIGSEEDLVVAVLLKVLGDAPGNILFLINNERSEELAKMILYGYNDFSEEMYMSVFQELGNILGNSYLNAITKLTRLNMVSTVPSVAKDMLAAILSASFMDAEQYDDYVLSIDTNFIENNKESGGNLFYIPSPGSLEIILNRLGL